MAVNPTFGINNFNKPKVQSELQTIVNDVLMILFGKPGFYPSAPELGMDIKKYLYNFDDEINTESIKNDLVIQCEDFLDYVDDDQLNVVQTEYKGNLLLIFVLPLINDLNKRSVSLGVTINEKGELVYNFVENQEGAFD